MSSFPKLPIVAETIASHPSLPINYIWTPKNACSTVKATLLRMTENPHALFQSSFCENLIDVSKPFFCLTRNPYDRVLSAFLSTIGAGKDPFVWRPFCEKYGFELNSHPTLTDFLQTLHDDEDQSCFDIHFRPQYLTNNFFHVKPCFTGRVEDMSSVAEFLSSHGFTLVNYAPPHDSSIQYAKSDHQGAGISNSEYL